MWPKLLGWYAYLISWLSWLRWHNKSFDEEELVDHMYKDVWLRCRRWLPGVSYEAFRDEISYEMEYDLRRGWFGDAGDES